MADVDSSLLHFARGVKKKHTVLLSSKEPEMIKSSKLIYVKARASVLFATTSVVYAIFKTSANVFPSAFLKTVCLKFRPSTV